ncbi:MAG TPA: hypothetical protein VIM33_04830 [Gaiellaceae bacterium]
MTDAEARDYAVAALEGFARELEEAWQTPRELSIVDYIERMRTAAGRLDFERLGEDRLSVLELAIASLTERVDFLTGRILGGAPTVGAVLLDGEELDREERRELTLANIERRQQGLDSRTFRQ